MRKTLPSVSVLIVDDEPLARQKIRRLLSEAGASEKTEFIIQEATNGLEALDVIPQFKPEIVFLDIQMPGLNGFEVLQQLEQRAFQLIFQTAYDEFAIRAFDENACDYLLKPFAKERFDKALERALVGLKTQKANGDMAGLERALKDEKKYLEKLALKQGTKLKLIPLEEINCFISQDHYTCVYTKDGEFICDLSLSHLEERLSPDLFWRLHRNNIVKLSSVKSVVGGENMTVEVAGPHVLPVSRNNRKRVAEFAKKT